MKSITEIENDLHGRLTGTINSVNKQIDILSRFKDVYYVKAMVLQACLPRLVEALGRIGLEISTLGFVKTGPVHRWDDGDTLKLDLSCIPSNGSKFHFIKFSGYDSKGDGKNRNKLLSKAKEIQSYILTQLPELSSVQVNPFSVEIRPDSRGVVLIEITAW